MEGLDIKQLTTTIHAIAEEKNLPEDVVVQAVEAAIAAAWRRDNGDRDMNVRAILNQNDGTAKIIVHYDVVENPDGLGQITLERAKEIDKDALLNGVIEKEYEALLVGKMENKEGVIDAPMRLDVDNRPYQIIDFERGKRAVTAYKLLDYEWKEGVLLSRVRFFPETGRTHQLRVHSSYIGHPILSDRLYGTYIEGVRLMLHASKITFTHPRSKKTMIISSEAPF